MHSYRLYLHLNFHYSLLPSYHACFLQLYLPFFLPSFFAPLHSRSDCSVLIFLTLSSSPFLTLFLSLSLTLPRSLSLFLSCSFSLPLPISLQSISPLLSSSLTLPLLSLFSACICECCCSFKRLSVRIYLETGCRSRLYTGIDYLPTLQVPTQRYVRADISSNASIHPPFCFHLIYRCPLFFL